MQVGKLQSEEAIFESVCPYKLYMNNDSTIHVASNNNGSDVDTVVVKHWNGTTELCTTCNDHTQDLFLFGDHDCSLHSVTKEMRFNWSIKLDSPIGSCPFIENLNSPKGMLSICCCCTTNGSIFILDIATGKILATTKLPGEIFSSPLIVGDQIVVGCRDNNVYCLKLHTKINNVKTL